MYGLVIVNPIPGGLKESYEGFRIMTLPVRSDGAIFPAARRIGKFQGTIAPTTPNGVY